MCAARPSPWGKPSAAWAALSYTLLYAVARFILEFFRGDADRGFVFGGLLSTSQFIAVLLAPVAIGLWVARRQRTPGS